MLQFLQYYNISPHLLKSIKLHVITVKYVLKTKVKYQLRKPYKIITIQIDKTTQVKHNISSRKITNVGTALSPETNRHHGPIEIKHLFDSVF